MLRAEWRAEGPHSAQHCCLWPWHSILVTELMRSTGSGTSGVVENGESPRAEHAAVRALAPFDVIFVEVSSTPSPHRPPRFSAARGLLLLLPILLGQNTAGAVFFFGAGLEALH